MRELWDTCATDNSVIITGDKVLSLLLVILSLITVVITLLITLLLIVAFVENPDFVKGARAVLAVGHLRY